MTNSECKLVRNDELKAFIRRGVPAEQRRRIWPFITNAGKLKDSHPGYYHGVLNQHRKMESEATKQIELVRSVMLFLLLSLLGSSANVPGASCLRL